VFAADREGSIDLPVEPLTVRAWVLVFMEERTSELDGWSDNFRDANQKVGGEHRPDQTVGAGLSPGTGSCDGTN
jgi:hypothetical protein